jgi:hypothetical protein
MSHIWDRYVADTSRRHHVSSVIGRRQRIHDAHLSQSPRKAGMSLSVSSPSAVSMEVCELHDYPSLNHKSMVTFSAACVPYPRNEAYVCTLSTQSRLGVLPKLP